MLSDLPDYMRNHRSLFAAIGFAFATLILSFAPVVAQQQKPAPAKMADDEAEAKYTRAIEGRTTDILKVLELADSAKSARVHDVIMAQYRGLRAWHDANDADLKKLTKQAAATEKANSQEARDQLVPIQASLKALHDAFIAKLGSDLTPAQVEKVKDKMTYNKVEVTYNSYVEIVPNLTAQEKAKMLELLKEAREEAMDAGSAAEKTALFQKYKGKINNYLSAQGHDVGKAYKDWGQKQKEKGQPAAKAEPPE
jgi:hypothetical protein